MKLQKYDMVQVNNDSTSKDMLGYVVEVLDSSSVVEVLFRFDDPNNDFLEPFVNKDLRLIRPLIDVHSMNLYLQEDIDNRVSKIKEREALKYVKATKESNLAIQANEASLKHYTNLLVDKICEEEYEDFKNFMFSYMDLLEPTSHPYLLAREIDRLSHGGSVELIRANKDLTEVTCKSFVEIISFYRKEFNL